MLRSPCASFVILFAVAGCSAPAAGTDASTASDASGSPDAPELDGGTPTDAVVADHDTGPRPDAGCPDTFAACAHPPAGFTLCGGGAIDGTAARAACDALDPPRDIFTGIMKACSAFSIESGHYEVYCGASEIYVWASLDALSSADVLTCDISVPLPDGGTLSGAYYDLAWGLEDTNNLIYGRIGTGGGGMLDELGWPYASSGRTDDPARWEGSLAVDGTLAVSAGTTSGTGTLYLTAMQTDCDGIPTGDGARVVIAVPITWGS